VKAGSLQKSVLIVEDEFLLALNLQLMLEAQGWRIMGPAATVKQALHLLEQDVPSIALLDVNLGREYVTPVAEVLKARGVPFVLASAYDKPEQFGGAILAGALNVGKPTGEKRLLAALELLTRG
jgi:two-component system, response regulator PdtaR